MNTDTQYYPFGLTMAGISSKAAGRLENKRKFNGYEENKELGVNWLESFYRTYDPQLGRFWQVDPKVEEGQESGSPYSAMANDPILHNDPLGDVAEEAACCPEKYLYKAAGDITKALASAWDNVASFFTKSETEISKPSSVTSASTVTTITATTQYGTNFLGVILHSGAPNATISNGPSLFKSTTTREVKVELKQEVKTNQGTLSTKTGLNGFSVETKVEANVRVKKLPVTVSASNSHDFQTNENKTKVKAGVGTNTNQAFGQVEVSKTNNKRTISVSVGVEEKKGNIKQTFSIGKSF